jgi:diguanylate cyclase (GGDEF)-like protein/PAS domain S-box-containing protein
MDPTKLIQLLDISRQLGEERDLDSLLEYVTQAALNLTQVDCGYLVLLDEDGDITNHAGLDKNGYPLVEPPEGLSQTTLTQVLASGKPSLHTETLPSTQIISTQGSKIRSAICVPLIAQEKVTGALYLETRSETEVLGPENLELLEHFVLLVAVAIENTRRNQALEATLAAHTAKLNYATERLQTEIKERFQVEEAMKLNEDKFFKVFQSSPDAILISRLDDGQLIEVNDGFYHLTGYSHDEALFRTSQELNLWANPDDRKKIITALYENQRIRDHEYEFRTKSGRIVHTLYSGEIIFLGDEAHIISVVRDISNQKQAERLTRLRLELWEYSTTHPLEELMQKALDEIGALTSSPIGFYHFVEEDQNSLTLQAWSTRTLNEFCTAEGKGLHYNIDEAGVWVDAFHQRLPVIHNDYSALPHRKGLPEGHAEVIRELVVPVLRKGRVVSILGVGNKSSNYDEHDVELVSYIADIVWNIIDRKRTEEQIHQLNAQLEEMAMTDELTGILNRRSFFNRGEEEAKRFSRYQTTFSVLVLDIDGFKKINDTYGHDAGDQALKYFVDILQHNIRNTDLLARLGGEEFGIILPNTGSKDALATGEKLRLAVEHQPCPIDEGQNVHVTASIGVTTANRETGDFDALLKQADIALYQAKNQGRNRVSLFEG